MIYILIDNEGDLHVKDGTYEQARAEVGQPGWDRVRLPSNPGHPDWAGWVNDDGHRLGLPRNITGGLVLTAMGAAIMPYAGPVVFTGWRLHGQPNEVCGLDDIQVAVITDTHDDARRALAGEDGWGFPAARAIAEQMRSAPAPTLTIRPIEEFFGGRP